MVEILIDGGKKYNRERRSIRKRKTKRRANKRSNARERPIIEIPTKYEYIDNAKLSSDAKHTSHCRPSKFKPTQFELSSKVPLIVFGDGMFGKDNVKLKGNRCGVTGILWKALKRREKSGNLVAVTVDEYLTSQICSVCKKRRLVDAGNKGRSTLICLECLTIWQRDVNAARNMLEKAESVWKTGEYPEEFKRKK